MKGPTMRMKNVEIQVLLFLVLAMRSFAGIDLYQGAAEKCDVEVARKSATTPPTERAILT